MIPLSKQERKNIFKVYDIIRKNSRLSYKGIAKQAGLTRQTVATLFKKMEKTKMIWGYCAVIDARKYGYNTYILLIKSTLPFKNRGEVFQSMIKEKYHLLDNMDDMYISYSGHFHGPYDWLLMFFSPDIQTARKCVNKLIEGYDEYIEDIQLEEQVIPFSIAGIRNPDFENEINELF